MDKPIDLDQVERYQDIRNKAYAVVGLALTGLVLFGVISEGEREGVEAALVSLGDHGEAIAGIVVSAVAWIKSRTSRVSVVPVPMKNARMGDG